MKTHILTGSKQEIADSLIQISGDVREVIVFEQEVAQSAAVIVPSADVFDEMTQFMVDASGVDDTRESVYSRVAGE